MKIRKFYLSLFLVFFSFSAYAKPLNAMDSIARELVSDFDSYDKVTVLVGGFDSDTTKQERKQIEQDLQVALFRTKKVEIIEASKTDEDLEGVDYLCTGNIKRGRSSYHVTAKLIDNETGKLEAVSTREVPKNSLYDDYYAFEDEGDKNDEWEKLFWASVLINATRPRTHIHINPAPPAPAPARPSKPSRQPKPPVGSSIGSSSGNGSPSR